MGKQRSCSYVTNITWVIVCVVLLIISFLTIPFLEQKEVEIYYDIAAVVIFGVMAIYILGGTTVAFCILRVSMRNVN